MEMESGSQLLVVGGGLAGLAAAQTARRAGASAVVCEAADELGGLARSVREGGYTFDYSGHLLHLAKEQTRGLVDSLPYTVEWDRLDRRSAVLMADTLIPYPFQLHLAHAPEAIRAECVAGLPAEPPQLPEDPSEIGFDEWIMATLGGGIAKHFMNPYNEKLSGTPVSDMTCEWLGRFVPRPSREQIIEGAESKRVLSDGYNARFIYPSQGGIDHLVRALASGLEDVRLSTAVERIDADRRVAVTASGAELPWEQGVVATAALPSIAGGVTPRPASAALADDLTARSVTCVNFGVRAVNDRFDGLQWIYLPENRFSSYRLGFFSRFSTAMAPPGHHSIYVEISHDPGTSIDSLVSLATADLLAAGVIGAESDIEIVTPLAMPTAYVIHTPRTSAIRRALLSELSEMGIETAGRYGRWEYASMEDAIWQGMQAATTVLGIGEQSDPVPAAPR